MKLSNKARTQQLIDTAGVLATIIEYNAEREGGEARRFKDHNAALQVG